ncbi:preprotein translocase subunit SecE [Nakamurella deserti]|uniref:preprotein translocase subunit SecE n=1 Tax=Nakamurella deserti TaxID=2164074 RepID=UPI001F0CB5A6|nr:preprotein translocase subunit SecE [Nakamurella deserti]
MSKDRDGFSDDENLAPGVPGADGVPSTGSTPFRASSAAGDSDDVLHDPETTAPDAIEVEAQIEAAEESAGLEPGASDDATESAAAQRAEEADGERVESEELVGAGVGGGSRGRRGNTSAAVTGKKDAPTKSRDVADREGMFARLSRFLREVVAELRKVIWPSRKQMVTYTVVVIVFLVIMVALVSGLDLLFHLIVSNVLG